MVLYSRVNDTQLARIKLEKFQSLDFGVRVLQIYTRDVIAGWSNSTRRGSSSVGISYQDLWDKSGIWHLQTGWLIITLHPIHLRL